MSKPKHVYLVDGSGYIFRAFHALPPLTRSDGTHVNAVLGFPNMLLKLLEETDADHIGVIFDAGRTSFRNEIYAEYIAKKAEEQAVDVLDAVTAAGDTSLARASRKSPRLSSRSVRSS